MAEVILTYTDGQTERLALLAGRDTAEGNHNNAVAHPQANVGVAWPYEQGGVDYITVKPLRSIAPLVEISVQSMLSDGTFVLRGVSLINQPTTTSRSIILSTEGDYRQVHSGDVKVYQNGEVLPRTTVVHQLQVVANEEAAIATMTAPAFNYRTTAVKEAAPGEATGTVQRGETSFDDHVEITSYAPERVALAAHLASPGWLILADTHYPGWRATVNGQATEIIPVNVLFRAVELPAGNSEITFEFKPASVRNGALVSGIALLAVVVLLGALYYQRRRDEG